MNAIPHNEPCPHCGRYANRGVSVDAVIIKDDSVLLIKRGVEPDKGLWATPGGYVDWNESTEESVAREVKEETGLIVASSAFVGVYSSPNRHPHQVINLVYQVEVEDGATQAGDDAEDARWFKLNDLPDSMAFDHKQNINDAIKLGS